ncbi:MAG TPA: OmpA family protein [Rudaea sp.]|nr:OmpA family protein [Rudaea sp.]
MRTTKNAMTKLAAALLFAGVPIGAMAEDWDWSLAPYAWLPSIGADLHSDAPPIDTGGTKQFSGWAPNLGFTIPLHLEGQGDEFGILSDVLYLPLTNKSNRSSFFSTDTEYDAGVFELAGVWSPGPVRHEGFEAIAGLRYIWSSLDFKLIPTNPALPSGKITSDKSYADFMLGGRYIAKLSDRWDLALRADGSWGSTDGTIGASADFTYATDSGAWFLGYRYLKIKLSSTNTELDVRLYGPQFGYTFKFGEHAPPPPPPRAAPPPPPPPPPPARPEPAPTKVTIDLRGVEFKFDHPRTGEKLVPSLKEPTADSVAILDEAIDTLKRNPSVRVEVDGHTDSKGSDAYNQKLSERRAKGVYDYLTAHGIDASRLDGPKGFGESAPIDTNDTEEGRQRNRRTELKVEN